MKKVLCFVLTVILVLSVIVSAEEETKIENLIDEANSTFESVTELSQTKWFRLLNANGDLKGGDIYNNISVKTDGGHTGNNYISMTSNASWNSPSINIYPFFKEAEADSYMITLWFRCNKKYNAKGSLVVRATPDDILEDDVPFGLSDRGSGNTYGMLPGTLSEPDENGWRCYVSQPFYMEEEYVAEEHHWWICFDGLPSEEFQLDFDDVMIIKEDDYVDPNEEENEKVKTEVSYLADAEVIPAVENIAATPTAEAATEAEATPAPEQTENDATVASGMNVGLLIGIAVVALCGAGALGYIVVNKKKQ